MAKALNMMIETKRPFWTKVLEAYAHLVFYLTPYNRVLFKYRVWLRIYRLYRIQGHKDWQLLIELENLKVTYG